MWLLIAAIALYALMNYKDKTNVAMEYNNFAYRNRLHILKMRVFISPGCKIYHSIDYLQNSAYPKSAAFTATDQTSKREKGHVYCEAFKSV